MNVKLNHKEFSLDEGTTLDKALAAADIATTGIAVAVNDTVVAKAEYSKRELHDGDDVIIIKAFYGG